MIPSRWNCATGFERDVARVDLDGRRPDLLDPSVHAEPRSPLRHHGQFFGRGRADRLEDFGPVVEDDLTRHPGRDDLASQLDGVHILEVEVEVDPPSCELQSLRERRDSPAGESPGERGSDIEGPDLRQGVSANRPGAAGLPLKLAIMEQDMMAILGEPDVDLDPLHAIGDGEFQRPRRVLGAWLIAPRWAITWIARGGWTGSKNGKAGRSSSAPAATVPTTIPHQSTSVMPNCPLRSQEVPAVVLEPVLAGNVREVVMRRSNGSTLGRSIVSHRKGLDPR